MENDDLDDIISALLSSTRREILKMLTVDDSYALEMSRWLGVSQQAINKQLEMLERAKLISSAGFVPSSEGASRKIYRPSGFSTITIDYSRNFFEIKRMELDYSERQGEASERDNRDLLADLERINRNIDDLMAKRTELLNEKDEILESLHERVSQRATSPMERNILLSYLDSLSSEETAEKLGIPVEFVRSVVSRFTA
jgi:ArsR family transcriptional regulator